MGVEIACARRLRPRDRLRDLADPALGLPALEPAASSRTTAARSGHSRSSTSHRASSVRRGLVRQPLEERLRRQVGVRAQGRDQDADRRVGDAGGDRSAAGAPRAPRRPGAPAGRGRARTTSRPRRRRPARRRGPGAGRRPRRAGAPGARDRSGRRRGAGPPPAELDRLVGVLHLRQHQRDAGAARGAAPRARGVLLGEHAVEREEEQRPGGATGRLDASRPSARRKVSGS